MTVPEVAELLRVSEKHVRAMWRSGALPGFKAGSGRTSRIRFEADEVEKVIEQWKRNAR